MVAAVLIGPVYPNGGLAGVFEKRMATVEAHGMQALADSIPQAAVGKNASLLAQAMMRELLLAQDPAGYVSNCRVIVNAAVPAYSSIRVPVLILAGDEDKSAPVEDCRKMFGELGCSDKKMQVLAGVGHWHCLEAADEVARLIEAFYHEIQ